MTVSSERAFARVLLTALAAVGLLGTALLALLLLATGPARAGIRSLRCVLEPMSSLDGLVHAAALAAALLGGFMVLAALRVASRERAAAAELRWAARTARLVALPPRLALVARTVGCDRRLDVVDATRPFAFVYGWLRPRVCVSTGLVGRLTDRELEAVLLHEAWHLARGDPARLLVVRTIGAAFPFAPPIRRLAHQYALAAEVAADRHAVATMGHRRWLAGALVKTLDAPVTAPAFTAHAEARVAALAGEPFPTMPGSARLAAVILCVELLVLAMLLSRGGLLLAASWLHPLC